MTRNIYVPFFSIALAIGAALSNLVRAFSYEVDALRVRVEALALIAFPAPIHHLPRVAPTARPASFAGLRLRLAQFAARREARMKQQARGGGWSPGLSLAAAV